MREKRKLLTVLFAVLAVLLGVWGVLSATGDNSADRMRSEEVHNEAEDRENNNTAAQGAADHETNDGQTASGREDLVCTLTDFGMDEVERIEIRNAEAEYTVAASPHSEASPFVLAGYEKYRQDPKALRTVVRLFSNVSATQVYERDFEKEKFGLQDPCATVKITGEAESVTLSLGNWNESASVWYVMKEGEEGLYCVSKGVGDRMTASPYTLLDRMLIPAFDPASETMPERLDRILVERPDLEEPLEIVVSAESADAYGSAYELISPVHVKISPKAERERISSLFGLSADETVGVYDADNASLYGLDDPSMVLTVCHDGEELKLTVGGERKEEGEERAERYFICSGSDLLYIIEEDRLPFYHDVADDLFFRMALLPQIDRVEEVRLNLRGEEYLFSLVFGEAGETGAANGAESTGKGTKAAGTKDEAEELRVTFDGRVLDAGLFRTFYSFLLEADIEKINRDSPSGEPEMILEYRYRDGGSDRLEAYRLADERRMGIVLNGEPSFEGRIAYLDKLQTELAHLLAGEKIDTNW